MNNLTNFSQLTNALQQTIANLALGLRDLRDKYEELNKKINLIDPNLTLEENEDETIDIEEIENIIDKKIIHKISKEDVEKIITEYIKNTQVAQLEVLTKIIDTKLNEYKLLSTNSSTNSLDEDLNTNINNDEINITLTNGTSRSINSLNNSKKKTIRKKA